MSKRAEEKALKAYPPIVQPFQTTSSKDRRDIYIKAYEQAEKDIVSIIQSRLNEIQGDAQPRPILRIELQEIINKIKNGDN